MIPISGARFDEELYPDMLMVAKSHDYWNIEKEIRYINLYSDICVEKWFVSWIAQYTNYIIHSSGYVGICLIEQFLSSFLPTSYYQYSIDLLTLCV